MNKVSATVRLQFHQGFTLDDAVPLVPYFARMGISHIYASPLLKARRGSTHGYDVVDPTCINPELGGEVALKHLVETLREYHMGLLLDFVPNHMAVGGDSNPWWLDVLEWGIKSPYAEFFDIQWNSHDPIMKGQLLVPFLSTDYGEVLLSGAITLHFDQSTGAFYAQHYEHRFPLSPPTYSGILRNTGNDELLALVRPLEALEQTPDYWSAAKNLLEQLHQAAQNEFGMAAIERALERYNPETPEGADRLHQLLEQQHYRLASWRTAADDINWRRFFDINELGALRVEKPSVFTAIHAKVFDLVERGLVDGLRIDHVDGLANPRAYCRKLRRSLDGLKAKRPAGLQDDPLPIFVEKILGDGEDMPRDWRVNGTTGYEFMNQVSLLQHDPVGELQLYDVWASISGRSGNFEQEVLEARAFVLSSSLVGDFEMVAHGLRRIARNNIATRDVTLSAIRRALFELIVHFPVYRTYAGACGRSEQDQTFFAQALEGAKLTLGENDWPLLEHLNQWLGGQPLREIPPGPERLLRKNILTRFQQLTSPAAAKAVEDTACYRSAVMLSRNDVGFDPQHFSKPLSSFHTICAERAAHLQGSMLTTATHDHKRGEDTRARLAVISERAAWYAERVQHWRTLASSLRTVTTDTDTSDGVAPSSADELILYQALLGSWPLTLDIDDNKGLERYLERMLRWQEKALREAKLRTSWSAPNSDYEQACQNFLRKLLTSETARELRQEIASAAMSIAPAGAINSLTQCVLRMTAPGLPDLYQGTEFWDFSLVDPDNREPVDFEVRMETLGLSNNYQELIRDWHSGGLKQRVIARTLTTRQDLPRVFQDGEYQPLKVEGKYADRLVAFARVHLQQTVLVIAPRLTANLLADSSVPHVPPARWEDTRIVLPAQLREHNFESIFSGTVFSRDRSQFFAEELLADLPVNILHSTHSSGH